MFEGGRCLSMYGHPLLYSSLFQPLPMLHCLYPNASSSFVRCPLGFDIAQNPTRMENLSVLRDDGRKTVMAIIQNGHMYIWVYILGTDGPSYHHVS